MSAAAELILLSPGKLGSVETRNRFIRSSTSETAADENGFITDRYREIHLRLARAGVGLLFTGHTYVQRQGKSIAAMTGIDQDDHVPSLQRFTDAVHAEGAKIFMQLQHAGGQSREPGFTPIAPSVVPNPQFGHSPREAADEEIRETIDAFGKGAARVKAAGFDGVHVHAGHGYLISEFLSPVTNQREDSWGGSLENRQRFGLEVYRTMRAAVGPDFPISWKLGLRDFVPGGLTLEEGLATAAVLDQAGVNAIEGSAGLMTAKTESAIQYAGVPRRRALQDKLLHRVLAQPRPEGYFIDQTRRLRERVRCTVICVGGLRTIETMESVVRDGVADFVSLARPFIREPDLVRKVEQGKRGLVECVSCNICLMHEGVHPLQCWRESNRDLLVHAWYRLTGRVH